MFLQLYLILLNIKMNKIYQNEGKISLGSLAQLFANRQYNYTNQDIISLTKIKNSYLSDEHFTYFQSTYRRYLDFYKIEKNEYFCTKIDFDFISKFIFNTDYDYLNKMVMCIKLPVLKLKDNYIIYFLNQLLDDLNLNIQVSKVDDELTQTLLPQIYLKVEIKYKELENEKKIIEYLFNNHDNYKFYDNYSNYENILINIANFLKSSDLLNNEIIDFFNIFLEYLNQRTDIDNSIEHVLKLKLINVNKTINSSEDINSDDKYDYYLFKNDEGFAIIDKNLQIQEVSNNIISISSEKYIIYNSKLYEYEYFKDNFYKLQIVKTDFDKYINNAYNSIFKSLSKTVEDDDIEEYNRVTTLILNCYHKLFIELPEDIKEFLKKIILSYLTNTTRNKTSLKKLYDLYDMICDYDITQYKNEEELVNSISSYVFDYILFHFSQYNITNVIKKLIILADNKFYNNTILINNYSLIYEIAQNQNKKLNEYKILFKQSLNLNSNKLDKTYNILYNETKEVDILDPETLTINEKLKYLYYYYKNLKRFNENDTYLNDTTFLKISNITEQDSERKYFFEIVHIIISNFIKNFDELTSKIDITNSKKYIKNLLDVRLVEINTKMENYKAFMDDVYGSNYLLYDKNYFINLKYCDNLGYNIIDNLKLTINNQLIEEWNDKYLTIYDKMHLSNNYNYGMNKMMNDYENLLYIPLHFFFSDNHNLSLPLINLKKSDIVIELMLKNINDLISKTSIYKNFTIRKHMINDYNINSWMIMDYILLNNNDIMFTNPNTNEKFNKLLGKNVKQNILISQIQNMNFFNINRKDTIFNISLKNSVKYIILYADCEEIRPFKKINIYFNGMRWINEEQNSEVFEYIEKYRKFTNCKDDNIYIINFSLYPDLFQPSGTINFSKVDNFQIEFKFTDDYLNNKANKDVKVYIYGCGYNILKIENGYGLLLF
jgi:hypothetical protein